MTDRLKQNEELAKRSSKHRTPHCRTLVEAMGGDEALASATRKWVGLRPDVMTGLDLFTFLEHELPGLSHHELKAATGELEEICKGPDGQLLMFDVGMVLRAVAVYEVTDYRPFARATTAKSATTAGNTPRSEATDGGPMVTPLFDGRERNAQAVQVRCCARRRGVCGCTGLGAGHIVSTASDQARGPPRSSSRGVVHDCTLLAPPRAWLRSGRRSSPPHTQRAALFLSTPRLLVLTHNDPLDAAGVWRQRRAIHGAVPTLQGEEVPGDGHAG